MMTDAEVEVLKREYDELQKKCDQLETQCQAYESKIKELESDVYRCRGVIDEGCAEREKLREQLRERNEQYQGDCIRINRLSTAVDVLAGRLALYAKE